MAWFPKWTAKELNHKWLAWSLRFVDDKSSRINKNKKKNPYEVKVKIEEINEPGLLTWLALWRFNLNKYYLCVYLFTFILGTKM